MSRPVQSFQIEVRIPSAPSRIPADLPEGRASSSPRRNKKPQPRPGLSRPSSQERSVPRDDRAATKIEAPDQLGLDHLRMDAGTVGPSAWASSEARRSRTDSARPETVQAIGLTVKGRVAILAPEEESRKRGERILRAATDEPVGANLRGRNTG
jgi:hypothetical protein